MTRSQIADQALSDARADSLLRITAAIETAVTLDELLMLGLHEFSRLLELSNSGVILLSEGGKMARLVSTSPPRLMLPPPFALAETTMLQQVVTERQPLQINVARDLDRPGAGRATRQILPLLSAEQIESLLVLPLVAQDSCIGMLVFASVGAVRTFTPSEIAHARLLAGQFAAAITSFRITEKAQRRTEELATLNDIAAAVASSLDTREVYHLVMEKINKYFRVDAGSLLMLDEETDELVFVMTLEAGEEKLFGVRIPRGQGIVWSVAASQRYDIVNDVQNDPRFFRDVSDSVGYEVKTILCVPIIVKGRTIGVIELLNKREGLFTEEEAERLTRMAATIGVAIENARLFQTVTTVRDRFEAILNSTNDGILMADMRDVVVTANPEAARLLQARREELIGRPLDAVLGDLRARAAGVSVPSWLNDGGDDSTSVVEIELAAPQRRVVRHYTLPVRETNGAQIGRLALFQDISKERELDQLREDYTGMLVHDLRAPLTAIMNGIMMVKRGLGGPISDQQQELLGIAHQGSQTMLEMINTLLDISKLEQGHMTLSCEPLSPYAVADATCDRLRVAAEAQRVQIVQGLAVDLPPVEADREKLVRVLQNLLDNAIKFSPPGGTVSLGAAFVPLGGAPEAQNLPVWLPRLATGEWLLFWVSDQGPGIPSQYHERIFEKFGQVRSGRKVRGTGLGLTFCKLAVEAHGGQIWLQSTEGAGSTFALALPLRQDQRQQDAV